MNKVVARQVRFNRSTANNGAYFEPHRRRLTGSILSLRPATSARLCVLGAGNGNDLDLAAIANEFAEVRLVDIDAGALARATERGPVEGVGAIVAHGGVDISGIAARLAAFDAAKASTLEIKELIKQAAETPTLGIGDGFDVVVSTTLLTQLMNAAVASLGASHPSLAELLAAIRTAHARLLVDLVKPGGAGLLVTDVVSSDICPQVATAAAAELPGLAERLAASEGSFFVGVDPGDIETALRHDPYVATRTNKLSVSRPWRWRTGPKRAYLVYAFQFEKV